MLSWWYSINASTRAIRRPRRSRERDQCARISTPVASLSWQIVSSGFFSPTPRQRPGQEEEARRRQDQVPHQRAVRPHLEVRQAQLSLGVLEAPLHRPA